MTTLLVSDPVFLQHAVPEGHPERPERLRVIAEALAEKRFDALVRKGAVAADESAIEACHLATYIARIRDNIPEAGFKRLDPDTALSPASYVAAINAVGSACLAVDAVVGGEVTNAFCAVRPPGHHAEPDRAMGFCLFNSAAIAARHVQRRHGAARVAIVDWDVHHGNGTQAIFWSDPSVLYASTHQMPLYPGTGAPSEKGAGNILNVPLAPGSGSSEFYEAFDRRIVPAVDAFAPDFIIISSGFDAHWRDPLASLELKEEDFAYATGALMDIAARRCRGRIVSMLEGGYDLTALAASTATHVATLMSA